MKVVILENAHARVRKAIMLLAGLSVIFVLFSGCIRENVPSGESYNYVIYNYSTPGFDINQTQAYDVWEKVKYSDDAKFVTQERNFSVTVLVQSYAQGTSAAEWIVVASSIPQNAEDIKMVVFRLDYQTFGFKRSYYFSYPQTKEQTMQNIDVMEENLKKEPGMFQSINEGTVVLHDGNYIYSYLESDLADTYLFSWDEIPGNDSGRLIEFLEKEGLAYPSSEKWANIEKIANNGAIRVLTGESTVILSLNGDKTRVNLRFVDGKTEELTAIMENGNLKIYGETKIGATIIFNKYAGRTIFLATRGVWISRTPSVKEVGGKVIVPGEEINGTTSLPSIGTRIESISSPAYRGTSTVAVLSFTAPDNVFNDTRILVDYNTELLHTDGTLEYGPQGFSVIPEKMELDIERKYLFRWDEIPGKDNGKLIEYLQRLYLLLDWLKTAKIEKTDDGKTIRVFDEANSISLKLNDEKTRISLRTGVYAPHELYAVMENNELRIYDKQTPFEKGNGRLVAYSNLTVKTDNASVEGDYFITATVRYRGWIVGKKVLSFKIGKGGKKQTPGGKSMTEGSWNIGYPGDNPVPLNVSQKVEMIEVALHDPYLKGRMHNLIGVTSEYLDLENYSGFFAVVTVDVGDPDYPGEIIRYVVDREERKILESSSTPRKALEYFRGEAFDEHEGAFTKRWDGWNFPGLWLDTETNVSTETLVIDRSLLDSSHRTIEKHNLIYTTYSVPYRFQVFSNVNVKEVSIGGRVIDYASIPAEEKKETYQAMGWLGEKYASMDSNRITKLLLEQNASEVRTLTVSETWNMGEGYVLTANSIDAKASVGSPPGQAWFGLSKDGTNIYDIVMTSRRLWIYTPKNDTLPLVVTYFNKIYAGSYTDEVNFKYTWLRSQHTIEIKKGDIFGVMEVTSLDNGRIELRNRVPIELAPGATINLMGDMYIKVGSSNTSLSFHPYRAAGTNKI